MQALALAMAGFVFIHTGLSATRLRDVAVKAMGEWPYRAAYSLASIALLAALVPAYNAARFSVENTVFWGPTPGLGHPALLLIVLGLLLGFTGILTPGPTLAGGEALLNKPEPAKGVLRITRHPFLWGATLWAAGHLMVNGDLASFILFGGILLVSVLGTRSIDRKCRQRNPEGWAPFAAATSNIPFGAILAGRNRLKPLELAWQALVALAIVAAIYWAHPMLIGVAPRIS